MAEMTPMMKQYLEIKNRYPECLLFFRLGDFYEMFFDDAKTCSKELELVLTGKDCGMEERAPMCGVPFHSYEGYVAKLVNKGYKVAICEQLEDPSKTKGIVKRGVIRIITPGTVIEGSMLQEDKNNFLCCAFQNEHSEIGVTFADCSTGEIHVTSIKGDDIAERFVSELGRFLPSEILINDILAQNTELMSFFKSRLNVIPEIRDEFDFAQCKNIIEKHFDSASFAVSFDQFTDESLKSLGCLLQYLYSTQMNGLERLNRLDMYTELQYMRLDLTARRNLELTETMRSKDKKGSLLGVLDRTKTAMGKRMLRNWVEQPLLKLVTIDRRLNAVSELYKNIVLLENIKEKLNSVYDIERIMTRIVYGSANAKELRSLAQTIRAIQPIKEELSGVKSALLSTIYEDIDPLEDICSLIECAIVEDPPFTIREGGIIRDGFHKEIDELRNEMNNGTGFITRIESAEKERTGISKLKVSYNRVFGYFIEVPKSYSDVVPDEYIRKQTTSNTERYITQELKNLEAKVLGAREHVVELEYQIFQEIRTKISDELARVQKTAQAVARLDVLCSFATVSIKNRYVRPEITTDGIIDIKNGRHPVVESLQDSPFVPNDTYLDNKSNRAALITGPNMAGKSTYMRQIAIIVLMAQIGCFVPAESAKIGIVDSIFTRVGASDDLSSGQSTFMVEMSEVASILKNATKNSLIVFDEIGRGTSTFDGMSIARAVLEYVVSIKKIGAKTLFATHYHELTSLENEIDGVVNYNIAVKKRGDDVTFLRRIVRGPADDSYGIEVAKLAGIPGDVVKRAKEVLKGLESGDIEIATSTKSMESFEDETDQMTLLDCTNHPVVEKLQKLDVNTLTPIEALQILYDLHNEAK